MKDNQKQKHYPVSKPAQIYRHVSGKIYRIEHEQPNRAKADLANLRRGTGKTLEKSPEIWGILMEELPEDLIGYGSEPGKAENAVFNALTLYGMAQRGNDPAKDSMNKEGVTLGAAAGQFVSRNRDSEDQIMSRLQRIIKSNSAQEMITPLRALIQILAGEKIGLDFARLGEDLYLYDLAPGHYYDEKNRMLPKGKEAVRLRWARDFYKNSNPGLEKPEESQPADPEIMDETE